MRKENWKILTWFGLKMRKRMEDIIVIQSIRPKSTTPKPKFLYLSIK